MQFILDSAKSSDQTVKVYFLHNRNKFLHDALQCFYICKFNNNSVTLLYYRFNFVYIAVHTNVYRDVIT